MKSFGSSPSALRASAALICVLLIAAHGHARVHRSQSWAENQFAKAESQCDTLKSRSESTRTRRSYEAVIASYRRIVLEAPTSSKADGSAFAVAELTAEMGRRFKDNLALYSAVREYKFLRREYPGSKHRIEALLAIGDIYKNELGDDPDARVAFEELLRRYPHSQSAERARNQLALVPREAASKAAKAQARSDDTDDREAPDLTPSASKNDAGEKIIRVTAVEHSSNPDYTRITVDLEQGVQFESQRIDHPNRIFFDLKNARLASALLGQSVDVDDGLVKKVRVAQFKPQKARIVIETTEHVSYVASLALNPPRLIIDVHSDTVREKPRDNAASHAVRTEISGGGAYSAPALGVSESKPMGSAADDSASIKIVAATGKSLPDALSVPPKKVIVEADEDDVSTEAIPSVPRVSAKSTKPASVRNKPGRATSARSVRGSEPTSSGERSLIRALGLKIGKIVIDPGHGGHDTGTIGPNGLYEKDLVLDVSRRLGKMLESRLGAGVVYTRRDDTFIPLETRTSIANHEQADLFISVHANASHDPDARGVETYYLNFTSSPEALEVAARENAASEQDVHELQDLVKKIALKEKIEESREFAADVQQSLHSGLAAKTSGVRDRGVKKAPFVVLIGANMPSILAEISFISNPGDERRLKTPEYRQRIAESLYRGISRYIDGLGGVKVASRIEKPSAD